MRDARDRPQRAWAAARNVLCVRLDSMGDLLMTTPALRAVRDGGRRRVTLLTSPAGAITAAYLPDMDDVFVYDAPWMKATAPRASSAPEFAMIERLRAGAFDAAIIFTVFSQNPLPSAMLAALADIPLRLAHCHENPYQLLTDWVRTPNRRGASATRCGGNSTSWLPWATQSADDRLAFAVPTGGAGAGRRDARRSGPRPPRPWLVLHPGATAPSRRYPAAGFAAAARILAVEDGWQVVFTGDASERELVAEVREAMGVPSIALVDALDLGELGALIALAPLVLTNNTGPAHLAAAVGTPVVDLYALTNPQHTPWAVPCRVLSHDVPCRNCFKSVCPMGHHHCLTLITPDVVVAAVRDLARETVPGVSRVPMAPTVEVLL